MFGVDYLTYEWAYLEEKCLETKRLTASGGTRTFWSQGRKDFQSTPTFRTEATRERWTICRGEIPVSCIKTDITPRLV